MYTCIYAVRIPGILNAWLNNLTLQSMCPWVEGLVGAHDVIIDVGSWKPDMLYRHLFQKRRAVGPSPPGDQVAQLPEGQPGGAGRQLSCQN